MRRGEVEKRRGEEKRRREEEKREKRKTGFTAFSSFEAD